VDNAARALIGRTLGGRFKLTSFIGEGAMAAVFRGEQIGGRIGEPREVAVKVMHRGLSSDRAFVQRFQREARAAARIEHENTVRILEHGCDRDVVYIAMELVSGQDLFEVLARERRLSQARAARIIIQVCAALEAAHRRGVVHRDLKPENVMLVRDPHHPDREIVKVLDFGIAKLLEQGPPKGAAAGRAESLITLVGTVIGTPEYMSPEQARGTPPLDARSDVYAVGVLFYHLVTGKLPFRGESPIEVILQHSERAPTPPSALVPDLHPELERIILTALAKWPALRQRSAQKLAADVLAILPALGDHAATTAGPADGTDPDDARPTVRMQSAPRALARLREDVGRRVEPEAATASAEPALVGVAPVAVAPPATLARAGGRGAVVSFIARWWVFVMAILVLCAAIWLAEVDARQVPMP
jgi:serine/threonine-protein kinase